MKRVNFKFLIITTILCLSPIILGIVFYNMLPDMIAVHWGFGGISYQPKNIALFVIPIIITLIHMVLCVIIDTQDKNKDANKKMGQVTKMIIPLLSIVLMTILILYSLDANINIGKIVCIFVGLMFIVLGNYIPKTKSNLVMGVRTKGTLSNEQTWKRANKVAGYAMVAIGMVFLIVIFFV